MDNNPNVPPELIFGLGGMMLIMLILFALYMTLVIWSLVWVAKDAEARGKSGILLALLMFFTWPVGLLVWIVARPPLRFAPPLPWPLPPPPPPMPPP
ncbi:MAG TPA: hypothetical protein VGO11_20905 [Chthoniobacteraceae bacterium]|jgi:hypothetical protein|nr:hypothetical protein [Chthoniobacteraceae bacterium]